MGANHTQPHRTRHHVLVLFPVCAWNPNFVEGMDHSSPNHPIHNRSWYVDNVSSNSKAYNERFHIFCIVHILCFILLPIITTPRILCWRKLRCSQRDGNFNIIFGVVHFLLLCHIFRKFQEGKCDE